VSITLYLPRELYYRSISEETGVEIRDDGELFSALSEMSAVKAEYDRLKEALESVREKGYGVVLPDMTQMQLEEPKIVRQGGKYSVKLKANAPAIHMMMTNIETEVTPAIGGETASEDIINFLLQGFDGDINRIWQSNIFGKSLYDIACESLTNKICSLSDNARIKLQHTLERMINEGSAGLICFLL
jgi:stage IV sporulation protein A